MENMNPKSGKCDVFIVLKMMKHFSLSAFCAVNACSVVTANDLSLNYRLIDIQML